jgi:hypothetical protein
MYLQLKSKEQGEKISDFFWSLTTKQGAATWTTVHEVDEVYYLHLPTDASADITVEREPTASEVAEAFSEFIEAGDMSEECVLAIKEKILGGEVLPVFSCLPESLSELIINEI